MSAGPYHFGDPCIHCGTPHDDLLPGPCLGDMSKAIPIQYASLGARWDGVEHYLILMSSGEFTEHWAHCSYHTPYTWLADATCFSRSEMLKKQSNRAKLLATAKSRLTDITTTIPNHLKFAGCAASTTMSFTAHRSSASTRGRRK